MIRPAAIATALAGAVALLTGCGASGPSRADVVGALTREPVPARYAALAATASDLLPAVEEWCTSGDDTSVVAAIAGTRTSWLGVSPFWFGPYADRRSAFVVDPTPRDVDVEALAAGTTDDGSEPLPVDAASLRELAGADQRGLGALELVVAGAAGDPPADRRCAYATGLADLVADETRALADEWSEYGATISADDAAANVALRNIISQSLFSIEMIDDGDAAPADAQARLAGVRWALLGDAEHTGITDLLDDATVAQLTTDLDGSDPMAVEVTLTTDVVGDLGTTVNFSDADGDG